MQIKQSTIYWSLIIGALFLFVYSVSSILMPFIFGAVVAYFLDPVTDKLQARGLSRNNSTIIVLGVFLSVVVTIIMIFGPLFFNQIADLISKIPVYLAQLEQEHGELLMGFLAKIEPDIQNEAKDFAFKFSNEILKISGALISGVFSSGAALFSILSLVLISPIMAFYLLRDWDLLIKKLDDLLPREKVSVFRRNFVKIDNIISAYIRGQVTVCLVMAVVYSLLLSLTGVNYSLAIGVMTGLMSFIPYIGMAVGAITGLTVAYIQFGFTDAMIWVAAAFLLGNLTEGNFVTPKLVGGSVGLHPAWIIFALLASGTLMGFTGVLIAIPMAAVIGVLSRSSVEAYKQSGLYLGYETVSIGGMQREGEVTGKHETPIFEGFDEVAFKNVTPKKPHAGSTTTAAVKTKKKKKKKKEPELKFPK